MIEKYLPNENFPARIVSFLRSRGDDVLSAAQDLTGASDEVVLARQKASAAYVIPKISKPEGGIPAVCHSLTEAGHLLEMYRRNLHDNRLRRNLERLANRLVKISTELKKFDNSGK